MKNLKSLFAVAVTALLLGSCVSPTSTMTYPRNEMFIKDSIEMRKPGELTNSNQRRLYYISLSDCDISILEITGYENQNGKGVVFGCSYVHSITGAGNAFIRNYRSFNVSLSPREVRMIIDNYNELLNRSQNKVKLLQNEYLYNDLAVNNQLVVSMRKANTGIKFDFWINGLKASLSTTTGSALMKSLAKYAQ